MSKAKRARIDPRQMALSFDAPARVHPTEGELAGLDRYVAGLVGRMVRDDPRSQGEVAAALSAVLGEEVSSAMLYAYAAEAKEAHNISAARFLALVLATRRADALDVLAQRIGCRVLEGEEYVLAQLGHVRAEKRRLDGLERELMARARPLDGRAA